MKTIQGKTARKVNVTFAQAISVCFVPFFFLFSFEEPGSFSRKAVSVVLEGRETQQAPNGEWYIERLGVTVGPRPLS